MDGEDGEGVLHRRAEREGHLVHHQRDHDGYMGGKQASTFSNDVHLSGIRLKGKQCESLDTK